MKLIILTTKQDFLEVLKSKFSCNNSFLIEDIDSNQVSVSYYSSKDYILCIPPVVDSMDMSYTENAEYVMDIISKIRNKYSEIDKESCYLVLHSGDFFEIDDCRRTDGLLSLKSFEDDVDDQLLAKVRNSIPDKHIYQFRHMAGVLMWKTLNEEVENNDVRCEKIISVIKK